MLTYCSRYFVTAPEMSEPALVSEFSDAFLDSQTATGKVGRPISFVWPLFTEEPTPWKKKSKFLNKYNCKYIIHYVGFGRRGLLALQD